MQSGKNIKVFLSSTFKDMDAERDVIMNRVAPTLQQLLEPQGITVQFIDLRWGVNTQDADEDERETVSVSQKSGSHGLSLLACWVTAMAGCPQKIVGR